MPTKRLFLAAIIMGLTILAAIPRQSDARNVEPVRARLTNLTSASAGSDCCTPEPVCCPKPCITYRHHGPKLCCGCCEPGVDTALTVKNPCTGCETEITFCKPACCTGEPTVCPGTGLFGRDVIEYEWCCGYRVRVAFKHCGDLLVTTWGR